MRNHRCRDEYRFGVFSMISHLPCFSLFMYAFTCACFCVFSSEILDDNFLTGLSYIFGILFFVMWSVAVLLKYFLYFVFGFMILGMLVSYFK